MNLEKAHLKALVIESVGSAFEDDLESVQTKVFRYQGAHDALLQAAKIVSDMSGKVRDDLMEGRVVVNTEDPLAIAKFAVGKMQEVVARLKELSDNARISAIKADGERDALDGVVKKIKKFFDSEMLRIKEVEKQIQEGKLQTDDSGGVHTDSHRRTGEHPGPPPKLRRQMEEGTLAEGAPESAPEANPPKIRQTRRRKAKVGVSDDTNS